MTWNTMDTAPDDGSWVTGKDKNGREALIQCRQIHPSLPMKKWFEGEAVEEGNWKRSTCFYPVSWRAI